MIFWNLPHLGCFGTLQPIAQSLTEVQTSRGGSGTLYVAARRVDRCKSVTAQGVLMCAMPLCAVHFLTLAYSNSANGVMWWCCWLPIKKRCHKHDVYPNLQVLSYKPIRSACRQKAAGQNCRCWLWHPFTRSMLCPAIDARATFSRSLRGCLI